MSQQKQYTICTIGGDGIGPEVLSMAYKILEALPLSIKFTEAEAGYGTYQKYDTPLPDSTIEACRNADAVLFGAVTTPPNIKDYYSPIVKLRKLLDTFANVRPFVSLPIPEIRQGIDLTIVRENTEGLYAGNEREIEGGAVTERIITRKASERIIRFAFDLAVKQRRHLVTLVHKANVMRLTDGLFLNIGKKISMEYPDIEFNDMLVDACAMQLIKKPEQFDIIVTTNMFGDILSDEAAALVGGLGIAASANIGESHGLFEPVHGSAPKYVGTDKANPTAMFFATVLMLEFLNENVYASKLRNAITKTMQENVLTHDFGGKVGMRQFTREVINRLEL